ncbi:ATP-binding cassette domain-containing protein [Sphingobacterium sp. T2]|uniref:ATP-binding cassette domain-containing protein n=1 Tax=Sphingobacterium sp. T2 TaxID=1590596 RepID=UPI000A66F2E5|nr:ATP-binding cassette domain-containing protein [Sphingobacterium sp. T2]
MDIHRLEIRRGESIGLVGNNGAGKTTLFSLMLNLIQATSGNVKIKDIEVNKDESWKDFTGAFLDESFLIGYLTPEEYFNFIGTLQGMNKVDVANFVRSV